jgi:hypothetical protein
MANKFHLLVKFCIGSKHQITRHCVTPLSSACKHMCLVIHSMSLCVTADIILDLIVNSVCLRIMWTEFLHKMLICVYKELIWRDFCSKEWRLWKMWGNSKKWADGTMNVSQACPPSEEESHGILSPLKMLVWTVTIPNAESSVLPDLRIPSCSLNPCHNPPASFLHLK